MKVKKEYLILLLVIVALGLYLSLMSQDSTRFAPPYLSSVDSPKVNRMIISKGERSIELTKRDEQWFIIPKEYPADIIKAKNMLKAATDLAVTALVSESGNYERYDLTDEKKIHVQIFIDDKVQRRFDIGRAAPTYQHTFVRLDGDPKVYHARGSLDNKFDQTIDDLRDKGVLSFDKESITGIGIKKGELALSLNKNEQTETGKQDDKKEATAPTSNVWQDANGQQADQATIDQLLNTVSGLKCDAFMEDGAKADPKEADWTMTFKTDNEEYALSVFAKKDSEAEQMPAISSTSRFAFLLANSRVETFEKQINTLLNADQSD